MQLFKYATLKLLLLFIFLSAVFFARVASAGLISSYSNPSSCDFYFSGEIQKGDAEKLSNVVPTSSQVRTLCLNSPGGDWEEGQKLFWVIWEKETLRTRILSGHICASSCAIAFLGGSTKIGTGHIRANDNVIEPGAFLGFHSPRLILPNRDTYSNETVEYAYSLALEDTKKFFELTELNENGVSGVSDFLFHRTLATPNDELFIIDTVGKANLANVTVANIPFGDLSWHTIKNVCDTAVLLTTDYLSEGKDIASLYKSYTYDGEDGNANPIQFKDRSWSWSDPQYLNFVLRGYRAPHVSEKFCKVQLMRFAYEREMKLPLKLRDPTLHWFNVKIWEDYYVPVTPEFANYAQKEHDFRYKFSIPWAALWDPNTPLEKFQ